MWSSSKLPTSRTPCRRCLRFFTGTTSLLHWPKYHCKTPICKLQAPYNQPQPILLFDLMGNMATDTLALQMKHHLPKYQNYLTLLESSRDCHNWFASPPLHAAPHNLWNPDLGLLILPDICLQNTLFTHIPMHQDTNATDPLSWNYLCMTPTYFTRGLWGWVPLPTAQNMNVPPIWPYDRPIINIHPSYHPILSTKYNLLIYGPPTEALHPKLWPKVLFVYRQWSICYPYTAESSNSPTEPPNITLPQCDILDTDHHLNAILYYVCPCW